LLPNDKPLHGYTRNVRRKLPRQNVHGRKGGHRFGLFYESATG